MIFSRKLKTAICFALFAFASQSALADFQNGIPAGWACTGTCGTSLADGVVTAPPGTSSGTYYGYVTTDMSTAYNVSPFTTYDPTTNAVIETNGSTLVSNSFSASQGQTLSFNFNYVTSDGRGYPDYAWARLINASTGTQAALLFTARTQPSGSIVPGQGLPTPNATLPSVPIISTGYSPTTGGPLWTPLGTGSSGTCWDVGCGYSGWVNSTYTIANAGNYKLEFGVVNANDTAYQSGLAFYGATIGGKAIEDNSVSPVPEPETYGMMLAGLGLMSFMLWRRKSV